MNSIIKHTFFTIRRLITRIVIPCGFCLLIYLFLSSNFESALRLSMFANEYQTKTGEESFHEDYPRCNYCNNVNYLTNVNGKQVCQRNKDALQKSIELIILVLCHPSNYKARNVIRNTWGNLDDQIRGKFSVVFIMGLDSLGITSVEEEHTQFGDIVLFNFTDAYRKLSHKVVHAFKWVRQLCGNAKYVMKTDTDVFVNVPFVLRILRHRKVLVDHVLGGSCEERSTQPSRDRRNPHFVSKTDFPGNRYPPYCYGCGYIMSMHTLDRISAMLIDLPILPNEDVLLGIAAAKSGVPVQTIPGINRLKVDYNFNMYCYCTAIVHKLKLNEIENIWKRHKHCPMRWNLDATLPICSDPLVQKLIPLGCFLVTFVFIIGFVWFGYQTLDDFRKTKKMLRTNTKSTIYG